MIELPSILIIGVFLVSGLICGAIAARLGMPHVVGYVLAGIIFSPGVLGDAIGFKLGHWADTLTLSALGIIAYLVGGSMTTAQISRLGKVILSAAIFETLGAVTLVFAGVLLIAPDLPDIDMLPLAIVLAAISASTAPASTVAILHQYRARGQLTTTLLGVVAVDDALAIIFFSTMIVALTGDTFSQSLGNTFSYILGGLLLGIFFGFFLAWLGRQIRSADMRVVLLLGTIFLVTGLAEVLHVSVLLSAMSLGFFARFFIRTSGDRLFTPIESIEEIVFVIFFTLAGAHFDLNVFEEFLPLIFVYFTARVIGKIIGASIGARLAGAPKPVYRWLGWGLFPQAGVAIGLSLTISQHPAFTEISLVVVNVILASTLLYEVFGPLAVRLALSRANELGFKREKRGRT